MAVRVFSEAPEMAGTMKKAFIAWFARRSRCGMAATSPEIFCSAEARACGRIVR